MGLMYGAIAVGVVMISLGLILNAINRFRRGDVIGGFLDKFGVAGIVFYWGVLAMIVGRDAISSRGLMGAALVVFLVLPALCWIIKEPLEYFLHRSGEHGTLGVAITESFVGAFEASFLSRQHISFVRLGAYAMTTRRFSFGLHARRTGQAPSRCGTVGGVVVVILEISWLRSRGSIASVQALSLDYFEFFASSLGERSGVRTLSPGGKDGPSDPDPACGSCIQRHVRRGECHLMKLTLRSVGAALAVTLIPAVEFLLNGGQKVPPRPPWGGPSASRWRPRLPWA
jgi:hypothetical protein